MCQEGNINNAKRKYKESPNFSLAHCWAESEQRGSHEHLGREVGGGSGPQTL